MYALQSGLLQWLVDGAGFGRPHSIQNASSSLFSVLHLHIHINMPPFFCTWLRQEPVNTVYTKGEYKTREYLPEKAIGREAGGRWVKWKKEVNMQREHFSEKGVKIQGK